MARKQHVQTNRHLNRRCASPLNESIGALRTRAPKCSRHFFVRKKLLKCTSNPQFWTRVCTWFAKNGSSLWIYYSTSTWKLGLQIACQRNPHLLFVASDEISTLHKWDGCCAAQLHPIRGQTWCQKSPQIRHSGLILGQRLANFGPSNLLILVEFWTGNSLSFPDQHFPEGLGTTTQLSS